MVSRLKLNKWVNNYVLLQQVKTEQDYTARSKVSGVVELKNKRKISIFYKNAAKVCSCGHMLSVSALSRELLHHVQGSTACALNGIFRVHKTESYSKIALTKSSSNKKSSKTS